MLIILFLVHGIYFDTYRTLTVHVDEDRQETVRLGLTAEKVLTLSNFYIGGIPPGEVTGALVSTTSFYGCIQNMAVDTM